MSNNTVEQDLVSRAPPPTPEVRPTTSEQVAEGPEQSAETNGSAPESAQETENAATQAATSGETTPATVVVFNPNSIFTFYVGPRGHRFTVDINDLRRESIIFRQSRIITSIELKHENPDAFDIIHSWFSGHVGQPPLSEDERSLFTNAAKIAKQLQIKECESQLLVIVHKTTMALASCLYNQMRTNTLMTGQQIADYVGMELEGYMRRSANTGGEDGPDDGFDLRTGTFN